MTPPTALPSDADDALPQPGVRLLRMVGRLVRVASRMARCLNGIARDVLDQRPVGHWVPPGFDPYSAKSLIHCTLLWTAVLKQRIRALMPPMFTTPGPPIPVAVAPTRIAHAKAWWDPAWNKGDRVWQDCAKPLPMQPPAIAAEAFGFLHQGCSLFGTSEEDLARIKELETALMALCPTSELELSALAAADERAAAKAEAAAVAAAALEPLYVAPDEVPYARRGERPWRKDTGDPVR